MTDNNCLNTYNSIGISIGMSGEEARNMVEYWRSPRMPSDFWFEKCQELRGSISMQKDVIIEKENVISAQRKELDDLKNICEKVLDGFDWDSDMSSYQHEEWCKRLHEAIGRGKMPDMK